MTGEPPRIRYPHAVRYPHAIPPARIPCPDCKYGGDGRGHDCVRCEGRGYLLERLEWLVRK